MRLGYNATHAVAIAMGNWAVIMSMKGGVAPSADDPEWAILLHMIWSRIMAFEAVWKGGVFAFGTSDLACFQAVFSFYLFPSFVSGPLSCKDAWDKGRRGGSRARAKEVGLKLSADCCCCQVPLHI